MARNVALEQLLISLRLEVGRSTNAAISRSSRNRYINILNRVQRRLYADFDWPFLEIKRDIKLQAGQRYYDFPDDIDMDRAFLFEASYAQYWQKMSFGVGADELAEYDSDKDVRSDPPWRWEYHLEDLHDKPQIELWPVPATNGVDGSKDHHIRVTGIHKLNEMVEDKDKCLIDADLIVLYAAAELLVRMRMPDAESKLENANSLYLKLKGRSTPSVPFTIGGDTFDMDESHRRNTELRVAYAGQKTDE